MKLAILLACIISFTILSSQSMAGDATPTYEDFKKSMDNNIDKLTYDDALINLGPPTSVIQGVDIFMASWSWNSRNTPNPNDTFGLSPDQTLMLYSMSSTRTETLQLIFSRSSKKLKQWRYSVE